MLIKLALRNLLQHRSKSLIVGVLMAFGVMLLVVGNSVMSSLNKKMQASFTEQYSGDLFIYTDPVAKAQLVFEQRLANMPEKARQRAAQNPPDKEDNTSIFSGYGSGESAALPQLGDHWQELQELDFIHSLSPQTFGRAKIENGEGAEAGSMFWGINPDNWQTLGFTQHLQWHEGGLWQTDKPSIALGKDIADRYSKSQGKQLLPGDEILLTVSSDVGMTIRPVTVSGIFSFKTTAAPQLNFLSLIDMTTSQGLLGLSVDTSEAGQLNEAEQALISASSESDLFGGNDALFGETEAGSDNAADLEAELMASMEANRKKTNNVMQQYHFVVIKLAAGTSVIEAEKKLKLWFAERELIWKTGDWQKAAGFMAEMTKNISMVLDGFMVLIGAVSIIIIMNTLVISVTERIVEIGTMRALGAQKRLVRKLILLETLVLAVAAGSVGILLAAISLAVLNFVGIDPPNAFFNMIFGGEALFPHLSIGAVGNALLMMVTAALIASLYPLAIALKVSPVKAMQG
ncbi:MAG: ABC transporter permease [Gammaproteobacteria bacterium]|nr:ABC transporter permease [Gammaproteobacteria bacterium]MDP6165250.1 FtsX-like permease family protein [Gammaproteobacteria bacterium]